MKYTNFLLKALIASTLIISLLPLKAQESIGTKDYQSVYIDENGVMRWKSNGEEIKGFGVNYTLPFAHAYRTAQKMDVDVFEAIDQEVYHFSRLGFDLYRVHVWDTEISDTLGNLLQNEHLDAFDYLIAKLRENKINYILTPIAFWGNGWPEKDEYTPGFSYKYGKSASLTNPEAIKAQENYLTQFMKHVNPYTKLSYWRDPKLIAVEISNEPHHRADPDQVESYVSKLVKAVKKSGYKNPVLYNFSHGINYIEKYISAGAEGGTFQWYPSGLGYHQELPGNFLPNVDEYPIPFDSILKANALARTVYEFDAADINKSYMYPAMARSFRTAGIQLATHFSYDPTFLAPYNTEYNTHFMNLTYAPHKALALMISARVFHEIPLYSTFCDYPFNWSFQDFLIDPHQDLALYNGVESYIYTHSTDRPSWDPSKLKHIAGHGSSPYVRYQGTGAYFLDQIDEGIWRLEVMPDVLLVADPFGRNNLHRKLALIQWNQREMSLTIDDLADDFQVAGLNDGNHVEAHAQKGTFTVHPGSYLLTSKRSAGKISSQKHAFDNLKAYYAPHGNVDQTLLIHHPPQEVAKGQDLSLEAQVISPEKITSVDIWLNSGRRSKVIPMTPTEGFTYEADLPGDVLQEGYLHYHILVKTENGVLTYPGKVNGTPFDWDFDYSKTYGIPILSPQSHYFLFDPHDDWRKLRYRYWPDEIALMALDNSGNDMLHLEIKGLHKPDGENPDAPVLEDYSIRHFIDDLTRDSLFFTNKTSLHFELSGQVIEPAFVQVALIDDMGVAYGKKVKVENSLTEMNIPIEDFIQLPTVIMPRPYPSFLPYYFNHHMEHDFDLAKIRGIQISISIDEGRAVHEVPYILNLGKIWLE